jgi:hypothetical protein
MGTTLGLFMAIVVMIRNLANVADMISSSAEPASAIFKIVVVFGFDFGVGATITGLIFEKFDGA